MLDVALRSLVFDRGKLVASLAGVALATTLLLVEIGLYAGLVNGSSALVRRIGGDVWLMAQGTEVVDNGDRLPPGSDAVLRSNACVKSVRAVIIATLPVKKSSGAIDFVQVVGADPGGSSSVPWAFARGSLDDLHAPLAVAVDEHDLEKLQVKGEPIGSTLLVSGMEVRIAALTRGIRAFSLNPYLFTDLANARRIVGAAEGEASYLVADVKDQACVSSILSSIAARRTADAHRMAEFATMTERYWVGGSGAGGALGFSALFSLAVGAIIVGQTLYAITKEHVRELATLRAMGGTRAELVAFIGWQSGAIALVGGAIGFALAFALQALLSHGGIEVAITGGVVLLGAGAVASMCALATLPSTARVLRLGPSEVLR